MTRSHTVSGTQASSNHELAALPDSLPPGGRAAVPAARMSTNWNLLGSRWERNTSSSCGSLSETTHTLRGRCALACSGATSTIAQAKTLPRHARRGRVRHSQRIAFGTVVDVVCFSTALTGGESAAPNPATYPPQGEVFAHHVPAASAPHAEPPSFTTRRSLGNLGKERGNFCEQ